MKKMIYAAMFLVVLTTIVCPLLAEDQSADSSPLEVDPYYFATGFDFGEAHDQYRDQIKFNIGVKYRLFENAKKTWAIKLLYNQTSFWNYYDFPDSSPFYDHTYLISPLFLTLNSKLLSMGGLGILSGVRLFPYVHESNGGNILISRGWDRSMLSFDILDPEEFVSFSASFWSVWYKEDLNKDIDQFKGYGSFKVDVQPFKILFLLAGNQQKADMLRFADFGFRSTSYVFTKTFVSNANLELFVNPVSLILKLTHDVFPEDKVDFLTPSFYVQWYLGPAENLRDYWISHNAIRVGISTIY